MHILETPVVCACGRTAKRLYNGRCVYCASRAAQPIAQGFSRRDWGFPWRMMLGVVRRLEYRAGQRGAKQAGR